MRAVDNPRRRFEPHYLEWLEEPPSAELAVYEEEATRTILSRNDSPDLPFRWSLNPYRGCTHACAYCYARPDHEYLGFGAGTDFDTHIVVKVRAADLLRRALCRPSWRGEWISLSGDTDCYQPLEGHYRITRGCLEACLDFRNPVSIVTKSHLVTRDVDLLADMARRARISVCLSIPFASTRPARLLEPGTPPPSRRFEAMRILSEAGVRTGVMFAPIIPGLNEHDIPEVLKRTREAGGSFACRQLLRLPGPVEEVFFGRLRSIMPDRAGRIESRIREVRGGKLSESRFGRRHHGSGVYWEAIDSLWRLHVERLGLGAHPDTEEGSPVPPGGEEQMSLF